MSLNGPGRNLLWHATVFGLRCLLGLSSNVRVRFEETPPDGPLILATNHISHFDPPLITLAFPRPIDWIAVRELFHGPIFSRLFTAINVIPINRHGVDRHALRVAAARLALGRVVGIFPEGGIRDGAASVVNGASMKGGTAVLAGSNDVPVVPGVILGSDRIYNIRRWLPWHRAPVWIVFGKPIVAPRELTGTLKREHIEKELALAFVRLRDDLRERYSLSDDDMPQPPRERMQEK